MTLHQEVRKLYEPHKHPQMAPKLRELWERSFTKDRCRTCAIAFE